MKQRYSKKKLYLCRRYNNKLMEILGQTPVQTILFIVIYTITGVVPLMAALYLLLRRGNAFAPDTTPPLRLRR